MGSPGSSVVDIYNSSTGGWSVTALSQGRFSLGATSVGDLAIFAGGCLSYSLAQDTATVDIYNTSNGQWTTSSLSSPRAFVGAVTVGLNAYFAGGATGATDGVPSGYSNVIDVFNASNGAWSTLNMPSARFDFTPVAIGTNIIFFGGGASSVDILNTTNDTWTTTNLGETQIVSERDGYSACTVGPYAVFYGGTYGGQYLNNVDVYDSLTNTWSRTTAPSNEGYGAAAALGSDAIFAGGIDASYLAGAQNFDAGSDSFSAVTLLSVGRYGLAATAVGNDLIFAGGASNGGQLVSTVDIYSIAVPEPAGSVALCSAFSWLLFRKDRRGKFRS